MNSHYECRVCGSFNTLNLGPLPEQKLFAGKLLEKKLPESSLFKCFDCMLLVRDPILESSQYKAFYKNASSEVWLGSADNLRYDQSIVKAMLVKQNKSNIKVLDVGCYTGELLSSLPESYAKYGIEMSEAAAYVASSRGIKIVSNDLYAIDIHHKFDVITAVDVIEHTENPEVFIQELMSLLAPHGKLIISTGNTDNCLWKRLKNRFWYSKFYEHISFIGERWLDNFCFKNNFTIVDKVIFRYFQPTARYSIKNFAKFMLIVLRIAPERYSTFTEDHFCFSITSNDYLKSAANEKNY